VIIEEIGEKNHKLIGMRTKRKYGRKLFEIYISRLFKQEAANHLSSKIRSPIIISNRISPLHQIESRPTNNLLNKQN
jgi:hypothetical protein